MDIFEQLRAFAKGDDEPDHDDCSAELETWDDKHYNVVLSVKG